MNILKVNQSFMKYKNINLAFIAKNFSFFLKCDKKCVLIFILIDFSSQNNAFE